MLGSVTARAQLVWQISGNGALDKSYLFATNKLTDISFLDSIPNLFKVYTKCDKVITEFVMLDYEAIAALRTASLLPDSVRLMNFYTDENEKGLNDLSKAGELGIYQAYNSKAWLSNRASRCTVWTRLAKRCT